MTKRRGATKGREINSSSTKSFKLLGQEYDRFKYWRDFDWTKSPFERQPWKRGRLAKWISIDAGLNSPGILSPEERKDFFRWQRWKEGMPIDGKSPKMVFFYDEEDRLRAFKPRDPTMKKFPAPKDAPKAIRHKKRAAL